MAATDTLVSDQIKPELFRRAVAGAFANASQAFGPNSQAARLGIVAIDSNLPNAGPDAIGETVSVPYFSSVGEMTEYDSASDGTAATPVKISMTKESATIKRGTINFNVSRWARGMSQLTGTDVYEELGRQVVVSTARYMERKIIDAAVAGNNQLVIDKYSSSSPRTLDYDLLADALGLWADAADMGEIAALAVHSKTLVDLVKMKDSTGRPLLVQPNGEGMPFMFWGKPIIVSDRLPVDNSGLTAVSSSGTTPPVITVANSTNREGGTGPVRPIDVVISCTTLGARGTWKFKISIDGGATYTTADGYTSAATVELLDPLDPAGGKLGVTLTIAAGTAAVDNLWSFKSILKHTSLIMKRGALAFWFNRSAMDLQTIPVPAADTTIGAVHCYAVAHRYSRLPGSPYPGIVKIRHNAGGL